MDQRRKENSHRGTSITGSDLCRSPATVVLAAIVQSYTLSSTPNPRYLEDWLDKFSKDQITVLAVLAWETGASQGAPVAHKIDSDGFAQLVSVLQSPDRAKIVWENQRTARTWGISSCEDFLSAIDTVKSIVQKLIEGRIIQGKYHVVREIRENEYLGRNLVSFQESTIKFKSEVESSSFRNEAHAFERLTGVIGVPQAKSIRLENNDNVLIFDLLGPSLSDLLPYCDDRFSLKTIILLADQLITRMQCIHAKSIIHGNVRPDAFAMGLQKAGVQVYVASLNKAQDIKATPSPLTSPRFHDMEYLGYMLVYLYRRRSPWPGLEADIMKEKYERVREIMSETPTETLCEDLPWQFATYLDYARNAQGDEPDYPYLRALFRFMFQGDNVYDWVVYKYHPESRSTELILEKPKTRSVSPKEIIEEYGRLYKQLLSTEEDCKKAIWGSEHHPNPPWLSLTAAHFALIYVHHDVMLCLQHPSLQELPRELLLSTIEDYQLPQRLWERILGYLELLQKKSAGRDHMQYFLTTAYQTIAMFFENIPRHKGTWVKCLQYLAEERMKMEEDGSSDLGIWRGVTKYWKEYEKLPPGVF